MSVHRTHRNHRLDMNAFPSMKALYLDTRHFGSVIKSTQGGVSEWLLAKGITEAGYMGRNVFWVLPDEGLVSRFVKERFNKTLAATPEYQKMAYGEKKSRYESIGLRLFGAGTIAFTGSRSTQKFTEFVADTVLVDELDRCDQANIAFARDRYGFSSEPHDWRISNPTITGYGIDLEYVDSTQGRWHIQCECGKLVFPDPMETLLRQVGPDEYLVIDPEFDWDDAESEPRLICPHCGRPLNRFGEGKWVEAYPRKTKAGYHFSKMFTSYTTLREVVDHFNKGLQNPTIMQRVYNADFGIAYDAPGAKITRKDLNDAKDDYRMHVPDGKCVIGIDVGSVLNVVIAELIPWSGKLGTRVVWAGTVHSESDIYNLYNQYNCVAGVIDAMPEQRMSRRVVRRIRGMFRSQYTEGHVDRVDKINKIVSLNRTASMDAVREGLVAGYIKLPADIEGVPEFYDQMSASTRIYDEDRDRYTWVEGSKPDHYHHAMVYMNTTRALVLTAL